MEHRGNLQTELWEINVCIFRWLLPSRLSVNYYCRVISEHILMILVRLNCLARRIIRFMLLVMQRAQCLDYMWLLHNYIRAASAGATCITQVEKGFYDLPKLNILSSPSFLAAVCCSCSYQLLRLAMVRGKETTNKNNGNCTVSFNFQANGLVCALWIFLNQSITSQQTDV